MKHELTTFTLRHLLERSASRHAHKVAVTLIGDPSSTLTYAQLKEKVDAVASYLLSIGVSQGDKIALIGENNTSWVVAYFAIITSGAIAVPILPDFSQKEVNHILEHSGATSLILSSKLYDKCASFVKEEKNTIIRLEDLFHIPPTVAESITKTKEFSEAPGRDTTRFVINSKRLGEIRHDEDALVSIIYTSGTTGSSKGVMLSNRNLASNASASVRQFFKVKPGMRFLSILPLSHSYEFTVGLLLPLVVGCEIHYLGRPPAASILLPALKKIRPHVMLSVPLLIEKIYRSSVVPQIENNKNLVSLYKKPFFRKFINSVVGKKLRVTFGGRLAFFGIGGAAVDSEVELFLKEARFPYAIGYGLTETSPLLAGSGPKQTKVGTIGYPLKGVKLSIDPTTVTDGLGEIIAKGPNVMMGYYNNEELTRESFTEDGWFKTGDLGVIEKRRLSIKGRSKTMILGPSGENIFPETIETMINSRPYVQESLVLSNEGGLAALIKLDVELMAKNLRVSVHDAKESAMTYLSHLKDEVNKELSSFSRIREVTLQDEPFQRTPTLKIKRYLYQLKKTISGGKKEE
ncbi:MAG: AMP-binding protein [Sphaerochaetaceae bacterium]|jgi:long-chain acyl-CoA synthetase